MDKDDGFLDKAIEGMVLFAFNQGEVCTCPSCALIQESIYDKFMERVLKRVAAIKQSSPLDTETMIGAQCHHFLQHHALLSKVYEQKLAMDNTEAVAAIRRMSPVAW